MNLLECDAYSVLILIKIEVNQDYDCIGEFLHSIFGEIIKSELQLHLKNFSTKWFHSFDST